MTRTEYTKIGTLSGAIVSTLLSLAASNLRIISTEALAYSVVMEYLLPLAVPLLLFRADLSRIIRSAGTLLVAFLLGSDGQMLTESNPSNKFPLLETATAIATSMAICRVATSLTKLFGVKGGTLHFTTAIVVILATTFPVQFYHLAPAGESAALILMQVYTLSWLIT
ncbi:uncharacterized protein [Aristolochia californica]|uniref:uncharacterized protein n=1 Tax=Aristolochia californica TaxID=171875 RepID=UPI0035E21917